jgi:hypothetical protein
MLKKIQVLSILQYSIDNNIFEDFANLANTPEVRVTVFVLEIYKEYPKEHTAPIYIDDNEALFGLEWRF